MVIFNVFAKQNERKAQQNWCYGNGGQTEYRLEGVKIDCKLDDEKKAIEFDFGDKWHQCIGQSVYYGAITGYSPACVLIRKEKYRDRTWDNYIHRFNTTNKVIDDRIDLICVDENGGEIKC